MCCDGDYTNQRHPVIRVCLNFQRGELKKGGPNMHVTKSMTSQQMMVELIGAATVICTLHGVCVLKLEIIKKILRDHFRSL